MAEIPYKTHLKKRMAQEKNIYTYISDSYGFNGFYSLFILH